MTLVYANTLLQGLSGRGAANMLMKYSVGTIKDAIRTVYDRKSTTPEQLFTANCVEDAILHYQYNL